MNRRILWISERGTSGIFLRFFDNNEAGFLFAQCETAFFLAKLYVERAFEGRLVKDFEFRVRKQAHFYDFAGHFQVVIFITYDFPASIFGETAQFVGNIVFQPE